MAVAGEASWNGQSLGKKLTLALGLPVGAAIGYLLYRRYRNSQGMKCSGEGSTRATVTIPVEAYKAIASRKSCFLNLLCQESGAQVEVDTEMAGNAERTFLISGSAEQVCRARVAIAQLVTDCEAITDIIEVPQTAFGRIIGRGGESIKALCRNSGARINCPKEKGGRRLGEKGSIIITGTRKEVEMAKELIMEKVLENEVIRKRIASASAQRQHRKQPVGLKQQEEGCSSWQGLPSKGDKGGDRVGVPQANGTLAAAQVGQTDAKKEQANTNAGLELVKEPPQQISKFEIPSPDLSFQPDEHLEVYVSANENPQHFWIQILGVRSLHLDQLTSEMSHYYNNGTQDEKIRSVVVGDIVAAPYRQHGTWHRARVLGFLGNGLVDVYYVDYGDNGEISPDWLRNLRSDFLSLPFQAIECSLAGVCPAGETWTEEALEEFDRLTYCAQWKPLLAKLCSYSMTGTSTWPKVQLYDYSNGKALDLGEELIRLGHAMRCRDTGASEEGVPLEKGENMSLQKVLDDVTGAASELSLSCLSLSVAPGQHWATQTLSMKPNGFSSSPIVQPEAMRSDVEITSPILLSSFIGRLESTPSREGISKSREFLSPSPVHPGTSPGLLKRQPATPQSPALLKNRKPRHPLPLTSNTLEVKDSPSRTYKTFDLPDQQSNVPMSPSSAVETVTSILHSVVLSDEVFEHSSVSTVSDLDTSASTSLGPDSSLYSPRGCPFFMSASEDSSLSSSETSASLGDSEQSVTSTHSSSGLNPGSYLVESVVKEDDVEDVEIPRRAGENQEILGSFLFLEQKVTVSPLPKATVSGLSHIILEKQEVSHPEGAFSGCMETNSSFCFPIEKVVEPKYCGIEVQIEEKAIAGEQVLSCFPVKTFTIPKGDGKGLRDPNLNGTGDISVSLEIATALCNESLEVAKVGIEEKDHLSSKGVSCTEEQTAFRACHQESREEVKDNEGVISALNLTDIDCGTKVKKTDVEKSSAAFHRNEECNVPELMAKVPGPSSYLRNDLSSKLSTVLNLNTGVSRRLDVYDPTDGEEGDFDISGDVKRDIPVAAEDINRDIEEEDLRSTGGGDFEEAVEFRSSFPDLRAGCEELALDNPEAAGEFGEGLDCGPVELPFEIKAQPSEVLLQEMEAQIALDVTLSFHGVNVGASEIASISGSGDDIIEDESI
ncbi:tudor and KH domain-containing protein isoform X1 [Lepisosteus oculatus]|uniref:tudor and KH domain-containing protein isoform X1 n=1 Tax=Lepisosteus oculatus TaxID=7918 RepID=UPI0037151058